MIKNDGGSNNNQNKFNFHVLQDALLEGAASMPVLQAAHGQGPVPAGSVGTDLLGSPAGMSTTTSLVLDNLSKDKVRAEPG